LVWMIQVNKLEIGGLHPNQATLILSIVLELASLPCMISSEEVHSLLMVECLISPFVSSQFPHTLIILSSTSCMVVVCPMGDIYFLLWSFFVFVFEVVVALGGGSDWAWQKQWFKVVVVVWSWLCYLVINAGGHCQHQYQSMKVTMLGVTIGSHSSCWACMIDQAGQTHNQCNRWHKWLTVWASVGGQPNTLLCQVTIHIFHFSSIYIMS
jgi:hypothetical protein